MPGSKYPSREGSRCYRRAHDRVHAAESSFASSLRTKTRRQPKIPSGSRAHNVSRRGEASRCGTLRAVHERSDKIGAQGGVNERNLFARGIQLGALRSAAVCVPLCAHLYTRSIFLIYFCGWRHTLLRTTACLTVMVKRTTRP